MRSDKIEKKSYASHEPVLKMVVNSIRNGSVVEFGCGLSSTPMLRELCQKMSRRLFSYESNASWLDIAQKMCPPSELHNYVIVQSWTNFSPGVETCPIGVAFVDHGSAHRRGHSVNILLDIAEVVICHDTERPCHDRPGGYDHDIISAKYKRDYTHVKPWTTVCSNVHDVRAWGEPEWC
jgi:hypothetical protein